MLKNIFKKILFNIPFISTRLKNYYYFSSYVEETKKVLGQFDIDHFHSPIPDMKEVLERKESIFNKNKIIHEIDFHDKEQLLLLEKIDFYCQQIPYDFKNNDVKEAYADRVLYHPKDAWYRYSDVIFLYGILNIYKPGKIIEVGCGFSSSVMLDAGLFSLQEQIQFYFIEPYPDRLKKNIGARISGSSNIVLIEEKVQNTDLKLYESLNKNDILFIDSSHVSKAGSDLNFILFEILPVLKPGVLIHFHDIFYPFEMPEHWLMDKKWYWNENYLLRAFLANNHKYSILAFNSYLQFKYPEYFKGSLSDCLIGQEDTGSIWLIKN